MWPLVRLIPEVAVGHALAVYNSQNVEAHLKHAIFQDLNVNQDATMNSEAETLLSAVNALEREVVACVDAVTACTAEDAGLFDS